MAIKNRIWLIVLPNVKGGGGDFLTPADDPSGFPNVKFSQLLVAA